MHRVHRWLWLCVIPLVLSLFTVGLWDRINPFVLGLPFNVFWVSMCSVLIAAVLWIDDFCSRRR